MITPNPAIGTLLHALGGVSASACYTPFHGTKKWSWGTFWIIQSIFAWVLMPLIIGFLTIPDFFSILSNAPAHIVLGAFLLGAVYGFGGMAFGLSIRHIGYSLTYTIAIGISAVLGTLLPMVLKGGLVAYFEKPGGGIVFIGMITSLVGVLFCGWAGFKKENDIRNQSSPQQFHMMTGLLLAVIAGILSGVFNMSLEYGQPIADMAAQKGAGHFEGNAKIIVSTSGCFLVNIIWFVVAGFRQHTLKELKSTEGGNKQLTYNYLFSALAGSLWFMQFFFYGLGHVKMGSFQFTSWVLHMSMLIFFSYITGVIMKEWKNVKVQTYVILITGLIILVTSFVITAYGSVIGEEAIKAASH